METISKKYDTVYSHHLGLLVSGRFTPDQINECAKAYRGSALQIYRDAIRNSVKSFQLNKERIIVTAFDEGVNYVGSISKVFSLEEAIGWAKKQGAKYISMASEHFNINQQKI